MESRATILAMIPGLLNLRVAQLGNDVKASFMQTVKRLNCTQRDLAITLHGTKTSNHSSICSHGLLIPGHRGVTVAHGSAYGLGIYTSTNFSTSEHYCDSGKIFVCAVVNDTKGHPEKLKDACREQATKNVKCCGDVMVIFNEAYIVPLYIAEFISQKVEDSKQNYWDKHGNRNHLLWLRPSVYEAVSSGKKIKRRRVLKSQTRELRYMREVKDVDQSLIRPDWSDCLWV